MDAAGRRGVKEQAAEWVNPHDLVPWEGNPRKNDGEPVERVQASIQRFGFGAPIVARRANSEIIAGHTRVRAAIALGMDRVPVRFLDISEHDAHVLALADNRFTELTEWDDAALLEALGDVGLADSAFAGWTGKDLEKLAPTADEASVEEVDVSNSQATFFITVRGPLPKQPGVIDELRRSLSEDPDLVVDAGSFEL